MPFGLGRDPLGFITSLSRTYGDVAHLHGAGEHLVLLTHPQQVKDVLVTRQRNFDQIVINHGTRPLDDLYFELKPLSNNLGEFPPFELKKLIRNIF